MQDSWDGSTQDLSSPNTTKPALLSAEPELLEQLRHLQLTRRPECWTKQEDYVHMNIRYFRYSCCWNSTWEESLYPLLRGAFPALSDTLDTRQEWERRWEPLTTGVSWREGFFLAEEVILYKRQQTRILCQGFCWKPKGERKIRM